MDDRIRQLSETLRTEGWRLIIKPRLETLIKGYERNWLTGTRRKGDEQLSDEGLKQRIFMARWMLEWEGRLVSIVKGVELSDTLQEMTEVEEEGRGPY